jgi:hypothetical protein
MQVDDLVLVSVDEHVVEPPDLFEGRLSAKAAERASFVQELENGRAVWMFEGTHTPREQATVGALRAQATDVDTTPVSHGTGKFQEEGIVTAMTLAERLVRK